MDYHYKKYSIGEFEVTRVFEKTSTTGSPQFLIPDWDQAVLDKHEGWLVPGCMDENHEHLIRSIHTWVIRTKELTILVDTAVGNDKERPLTPEFHRLKLPYLERLQAVGVTPEQVDYVFLTHLHTDHVGWNTRLVHDQWIPTFPNARYVYSQAEGQRFLAAGHNSHSDIYTDSVLPVIEAGQADMVEPDGSHYLEGIAFHSLPGHTTGHMAISLTSQGKHAIFGGDVMHHPIQVHYPEWNSCYCVLPEQARTSRRWLLEYAVENRAIFFSGHFAESSAGIITEKGGHFQWTFA